MNSTLTATYDATKGSCPASSADVDTPRVLLIGPSLRIMGGQAVMADRMVRAMRRDGLEVEFLPINPKPPGMLAFAEKIKGLRTIIVSTFYVVSLLRHVRRFDVIHLFSASYLSFMISQTPAIIVAWLYRKPVILNYRSGEAEDHLRRWGLVVSGILRLTQQIVVPSGFLVDVFAKFGFEAVAIPNVIDPEEVRYHHRSSAHPRIIVPRTLEPLYNVACAIRAFQLLKRKHPQSQMTVLGDGSQSQYLHQLVRELGLEDVTFAGRVERGEIGAYFERHDIFLNTSSIDNMPVSILEGFSAGLPIVTTNAGGIPYVVQDRVNGHLVNVDDHEAVAERLIELVESPAEVSRLSRVSGEEAEKYLWRTVADQWYQLYRSVLRERQDSRTSAS